MCTRELDGRAVEFGTTGYTMDSVFVLYDRDSDSVWYPLSDGTMDAVAGNRRGQSVPFLDKPAPRTLANWIERHPDSTVLLPSERDVARLRQMASRPFLGVQFEAAEAGLRITQVVDDSGAANGGLRADDVITSMAGTEIADADDLRSVLGEHQIGDTLEVAVLREGAELTLEITLGARPQ